MNDFTAWVIIIGFVVVGYFVFKAAARATDRAEQQYLRQLSGMSPEPGGQRVKLAKYEAFTWRKEVDGPIWMVLLGLGIWTNWPRFIGLVVAFLGACLVVSVVARTHYAARKTKGLS